MEEKIMSLVEDQEFKAKLEAAESLEEVVSLFHAEGVDITVEELEAAMKYSLQTEGELSEEALDDVAGGNVIGTLRTFLKNLIKNTKIILKTILLDKP